ncbi:MAG: TonB-dependent receptor [Candidatus Binatia bacterium]
MNAPFRWKKAALLGPGLMLLMIVGTSAYAQEATRTFHIPAQPLANALVSFSEQSGIPVMAPADLVRDKTAPAVTGAMPPLTALDTLLKSSGLGYSRSAEGALTIAQAPTAGKAVSQRATEKRAAPKAETEIEEIIVTAQKREENIQETPISMTALGAGALQDRNIRDVTDLGEAVPALRIGSGMSSVSSLAVTIRGLAEGAPDPAFNTKVGLYVDGAYLSGVAGNNLDLEDIERVEVLRGPQGTLYGRNTIGGAVNFITRKPTEERSITLKTDVGNYETFNGRVTFNVPLIGKNGFYQSDALGTISLRETVGYKTHDGYWRNALPSGAPPQPQPSGAADYNNLNRVYNWTALRWRPLNDITVDYSFEYHRYRNNEVATPLTYVYPGSVVSLPTLTVPNVGTIPNPLYILPYIQKNRPSVVPNNALLMHDGKLHPPRDDGYQRLHILTGAWDVGEVGPLGTVQLKSISSYRSFLYQTDGDFDGTPVAVADFGQNVDVQTWSQELQWVGTAPRFHYVVGGYYFGQNSAMTQQAVLFAGQVNVPFKNWGKTESYAAYGQAAWTLPVLSDRLTLTGGLRFTQEQIHMDVVSGQLLYPSAMLPGYKASAGKAFGGIHGNGAPGISPMGDIAYQWTDDLMTYVRVSRGFTGGGFNGSGATPEFFQSFRPETLWAFEGGFKSQWLDNRLRANADGFFSRYQDMQLLESRASPGGGALAIPANAERAEIWGMEFEGTAILFRGLEANLGYTFVAPTYTNWTDLVVDPVTGQILGRENVGEKRSFPYTPNHQISTGLTYTAPPTNTGTFAAHIDVYWQDQVYFTPINETPGAQANKGWAYAVLNGRLAYNGIPLQKGSLDIAVYGRNILDRKYRVHGLDLGPGLGLAQNAYGDPRTFGIQLTYSFSGL